MSDLLKQFAKFINPTAVPQAELTAGVAQNLMERAEAGAGRNPAESAELRDAARAFLSVVR
jgi:hypothetical protein